MYIQNKLTADIDDSFA